MANQPKRQKKGKAPQSYSEILRGFDSVIRLAKDFLTGSSEQKRIDKDRPAKKKAPRVVVFENNEDLSEKKQTKREPRIKYDSFEQKGSRSGKISQEKSVVENKVVGQSLELELISKPQIEITIETSGQVKRSQKGLELQKEHLVGVITQVKDALLNDTNESDIIIGLDIGTSSTKVVVRDWVMNQAYAVPFENYAPEANSYLLPTTVFVNRDGQISLATGDMKVAELKLGFINNPHELILRGKSNFATNYYEIFIGYLALVLRQVRRWFLQHKNDQYQRSFINWHVNVGIPSEDYDDIDLRSRFNFAAQVAWYVSAQKEIVDINLIKEGIYHIEDVNRQVENECIDLLDATRLHPGYFNSHPEVIMEVIGYVKSPLGGNGTHLLVDVGASTLDVASFRVEETDGESLFPILKSKVANYGSLMLHYQRIETARSRIQKTLNTIYNCDPLQPLPSTESYQVKSYKEDLHELDKQFRSSCNGIIAEVVRYTKKEGDPFSSVWDGRLPVFLCGGGSKEKLYMEVLDSLGKRMEKALKGFEGFHIRKIPKPENLDAPKISPNDYNRLAVAYGLSFSTDEIGEIVPESNVPPIPHENRQFNAEERFVGPEMV